MTCAGCGRGNDRARRYCGGCGAALPRCGRCGFGNDRDDHYCGGCGVTLEAGPAEAPRRITGTQPAAAFSSAELAELVGARPAVETQRLPDGSIGQDDLDRLFGGEA